MLTDIRSVWGNSTSDVFAVGYGSTILHYDGSTWTPTVSDATASLDGVWGSTGSDVFAVGYGGTILHYDGSSWTQMASGTGSWLQGVWGSSASDVFALGYGNTVLHYDGSSWKRSAIDLREPPKGSICRSLSGIGGTHTGEGFIVGSGKLILRRNCPNGVCPEPPPPPPPVDGGISSDAFVPPLDTQTPDTFVPPPDTFVPPPDTQPPGPVCPNGTCELNESCDGRNATIDCPQDCPGLTTGNPSGRYCCVNGVCIGDGCPVAGCP
jgi:hypothetical protein